MHDICIILKLIINFVIIFSFLIMGYDKLNILHKFNCNADVTKPPTNNVTEFNLNDFDLEVKKIHVNEFTKPIKTTKSISIEVNSHYLYDDENHQNNNKNNKNNNDEKKTEPKRLKSQITTNTSLVIDTRPSKKSTKNTMLMGLTTKGTSVTTKMTETIILPLTTASTPAKLPNGIVSASAITTNTPTLRTYLGMPQNNKQVKIQKINKNDTRSTLPKLQKTDAPMLNYIFDSFSTANKHHHHDQRYGPHFEDVKSTGNVTNITVQAGATVILNCRISLLHDKTVSWVKRKPDDDGGENSLELLTVGMHTYSGDNRYTVEFQYPNNWRLKITTAKKSDEGSYECQISTHPPRIIQINLHVNAPKVMIVDEYGAPLLEKYYEIDSTLQLSCIVRNVVMSSSVVYWSHGDQILNFDTLRGGVSVRTELMEDGANSTLSVAKINKSDSGNYTCSINSSHEYNVLVHILKGESYAELHHGNNSKQIMPSILLILYVFLIIFIVSHKCVLTIR